MVPDINDIYREPYDKVVRKYFDGNHSHDGLEKLLPKVQTLYYFTTVYIICILDTLTPICLINGTDSWLARKCRVYSEKDSHDGNSNQMPDLMRFL
jgi:hypothetical protein